jgi:hypothetical protein
MGLLSKVKTVVETKLIPPVLTISYMTLDVAKNTARWAKQKIAKNASYRSILFRKFDI